MKKTIMAIILSLLLTALTNSCNSNHGSNSSYQEKVMSVEETERSQPTRFLTADGTYNKRFGGGSFKVHGQIKNSATVATYKDAVVKVTYYTATNTVLGSENYTIYKTFPPHSTIDFELQVKNYKDVNSLGWDVVNAVPN